MIGKKIALIAKIDHAGSGYRIAEAVSLSTRNFVEYFVLYPQAFPLGLKRAPSLYENSPFPWFRSFRKWKKQGWKIFSDDNAARVQTILDQADIVHFKGDDLPTDDFIHKVAIPRGKPRVITVNGFGFRRYCEQGPFSQPLAEIEEYLPLTNLRTAITPDLNYPEFDGIYTQQAFDCSSLPNQWHPRDPALIVHTPSSKMRKGTDLFLQAMEVIKQKHRVEVSVISNVDYQTCLDAKRQATIFFDQANPMGFYGNSALEAMAVGIPTICHISDRAMAQSNGKITPETCPVVRCGDTLESMVEAFDSLLGGDLERLSKRTKSFCDDFHSYEAVGAMWDQLYNTLC